MMENKEASRIVSTEIPIIHSKILQAYGDAGVVYSETGSAIYEETCVNCELGISITTTIKVSEVIALRSQNEIKVQESR